MWSPTGKSGEESPWRTGAAGAAAAAALFAYVFPKFMSWDRWIYNKKADLAFAKTLLARSESERNAVLFRWRAKIAVHEAAVKTARALSHPITPLLATAPFVYKLLFRADGNKSPEP